MNNLESSKRPMYVIRISFDVENTDVVYFTSHANTEVPDSATVVYNVVRGISGTSQSIDPLQGNSTIGSFSFSVVDNESSITELIRDKLNSGSGLRHKRIVCYVGNEGDVWDEYRTILTYIIDGVSYKNGTYSFKCSDLQRIIRKETFEPETTNLSKSVNAYQGHIPATTNDLTLFPAVLHDSSYTDRPDEEVTYIQLEDEVIAVTGGLFTHGVDGPSFEVFSDFSGTHTGASSATVYSPGGTPFVAGALVGMLLENTTDVSEGLIISNTTSTATVASLTGGTDNDFDSSDAVKIYSGRGQLNTKAVEHSVDPSTASDRRPKITEHIFLAGPAPKVAYQILTGHVAENLVINSKGGSGWATLGGSVNSNVGDDPLDNVTVDRYNVTAGGTLHYIFSNYANVSNAGDDICFSKYLKYDGARFVYIGFRDPSNNYIWAIVDMIREEIVNTVSSGLTLNKKGLYKVEPGFLRVYISTTTVVGTATQASAGVCDSGDPTIDASGYPTHSATAGEDFLYWGGQFTLTNNVTPYTDTEATAVSKKTLPDNWHLGIDLSLVRTEDFITLGNDMWNEFDDLGRHVRFQALDRTDGKQFVEKEIMYWLASFMPIYSDGSIGVKRLSPILSDSAYDITLDDSNIVSYSGLVNDYKSVVNKIIVSWNFNWQKDEFTKPTVLIDAESLAIHQDAPIRNIELKGVHTGRHTDEQLGSYFDSMRDQYSGPPKLLTVTVLPSLNTVEVGQVVRVTTDTIRDFSNISGVSIDRAFEVRQVNTNWMTGKTTLKLFGSSQKAGTLVRTQDSDVLADSLYSSAGTAANTILTMSGDNVTSDGTLSGGDTMSGGIFYHLGDFIVDAGVTVYIEDNVELRVRGDIVVNGSINGKGKGHAGSAGVSQFNNGTTTGSSYLWYAPVPYDERIDFNPGTSGYLGDTKVMQGLNIVVSPNNIVGSYQGEHEALGISSYTLGGTSLVKGVAKTVHYFDVVNNSTYLTGQPTDLRGTSGGGGLPVVTQPNIQGERTIVANGGAGGAGGAGLTIIARGLSFGVSGNIDLSGDDGSVGGSYDYLGSTFYAGSGSGGHNGGLVVLLDGVSTPPDMTDDYLTLNSGDYPLVGESYFENPNRYILRKPLIAYNGGGFTTVQKDTFNPFPAQNHRASSYSLQYLPVSETVEEEVQQPPSDVANLTAINSGLSALLEWDIVEDVDYYIVKSGTTWSTGTELARVGTPWYVTLMSAPDTYDYMVKAVSIYGLESLNDASVSLAGTPTVSEDSNVIGTDDISNNTFFYHTTFDAYDTANTNGASFTGHSVRLGTSGGNSWVLRYFLSALKALSFTNDWKLKCEFTILAGYGSALHTSTGQYSMRIGAGQINFNEGFGVTAFWNSGTSQIDLYAYSIDGAGGSTNQTLSLLTSVADNGHYLTAEIDFISGTSVEVTLTVDGGTSYTQTITTNVESSGAVGYPMLLWLTPAAASIVQLDIHEFMALQL